MSLPESGSLPCAKDTRQKAQSTRQKGSPSGAHGEDPTATGQTANTLFAVCHLSGTRQRLHRVFLTTHGEKKEETARRRRNGREQRGGRLRREPNQTHGKQFQKNKKNQPAAPTAGRTPGAAAGETRGRGAAAGWRERKPPPPDGGRGSRRRRPPRRIWRGAGSFTSAVPSVVRHLWRRKQPHRAPLWEKEADPP